MESGICKCLFNQQTLIFKNNWKERDDLSSDINYDYFDVFFKLHY